VWVEAASTALYPDVILVCGRPAYHKKNTQLVTNPLLIVEVLSPSTREYDLGAKFEVYQRLPSLRSYWLVDPGEVWVAEHSLGPNGRWGKKIHQNVEARLNVPGLDATLALRELYPGA
jgi:Uma2 family endonuclease